MSPPKQPHGIPNHYYYREQPSSVGSSYPSSPIERYSQDVIGLENQSHCQAHAHLPPTSSFGFAHQMHSTNSAQPPIRLQRTASLQSNATGTNRSSLQGSSLDFHNLSQDSGVISPSPHPSSSTFLGSFDRGVNITPSPQIGVKLKSDFGQHCPTHQLGLPFPTSENGPPPLPPRKVNPAQWMARNPESPGPNRDWDDFSQLGRNSSSFGSTKSGASSSWRSHIMLRAENQRLSLLGTSGGSSSSDETEDITHNVTIEACYPMQRAQLEQWHGSPLTVKPVGIDKPPPPPPRDPRRRLQVIKGLPRPDLSRPVSFSFETQQNNWINGEKTKQNGNVNDPRLRPWHRSSSEQNIAPIEMNVDLSPPLPPAHFGDEFDIQPRSRRPVQLQKSLPPKMAFDEFDNANHFHRSQPSLLNLPPMQNPPAEYWKSPPPMNSTNYLMHEKTRMVLSDQSRDASPQRPLRKKQAMSESKKRVLRSQDSALHSSSLVATSSSSMETCGKSSPSSISSRDSGCSEPKSVSNRESRPLSAVWEKHESLDKENSPPVKELSPPRSFAHDPGFSTKNRRSKFREALNELEDVISGIQKDQDLLDRAERRDLPTAHQELIAQARERFQVPSEENSRLDDDSNELFSDMDNFMNWNTSSSFENLPSLSGSPVPMRPRSRTPASRRSGVIDKKTDDMLYRVIRSNNRPLPEVANPISKVNFSYLENTPGLNPATCTNNAITGSELSFYRPEPDTHVDDVQYRKIRHANANAISDPQSKFGIPKEEVLPCSERDYLHAVPDDKKYRSTFNAMRNPDLVKDDLAFRNLRKDSNHSEPSALGIVKDPNVEDKVHSCWLHRRLESEYKDEVDPNEMTPYVFYPKKNQNLLKALSEHIAQVIRKQSHSSSAQGDPNEVVFSYEDLRDPEIMKAVKQSLDIQESEEDILREEQEKLEWKGKNVFDLLTSNIDEILQRKRIKNQTRQFPDSTTKVDHLPVVSNEAESKEKQDSPEESSGSVQMPDVIVQHCVLEHSPAVHACFQKKLGDFPKEDEDQSKSTEEHMSDLPLSLRLSSLKNSKEPPKLKLLSLIENMRESEREMERAASHSDELTEEIDKLEQNLADRNPSQPEDDRPRVEEDDNDASTSKREETQASAELGESVVGEGAPASHISPTPPVPSMAGPAAWASSCPGVLASPVAYSRAPPPHLPPPPPHSHQLVPPPPHRPQSPNHNKQLLLGPLRATPTAHPQLEPQPQHHQNTLHGWNTELQRETRESRGTSDHGQPRQGLVDPRLGLRTRPIRPISLEASEVFANQRAFILGLPGPPSPHDSAPSPSDAQCQSDHDRERRQRSRSLRRETRRRRELSAGAPSSANLIHSNPELRRMTMAPPKIDSGIDGGVGGGGGGGGSKSERMAKYKEERRKQLASQIASRLSQSAASSSSDDDNDSARNYQSYSRYRRRKKRDGATPPSSSNNSTSQLAPLADPQPPVVRRSSSLRQTRTFAHESQTLPVRDNSSPEHIYHEIGEVGCGLQLNGPRGTSASDHFSASAKLQPRYVSREHIVIKSEEVRQTSPDDSKLRATPPIPAPRRRDVNKGRKDPTKEREALSMVEPSKVSLFGLEERQFQPIKASSLQGLSGSSRNSFRDSSSPGGGSESLLSHHRSSPSYLRKALEGNSSSKAPIAPTSYSSEEILFQAASDLQGLNGQVRTRKRSEVTSQVGDESIRASTASEDCEPLLPISKTKPRESPLMVKKPPAPKRNSPKSVTSDEEILSLARNKGASNTGNAAAVDLKLTMISGSQSPGSCITSPGSAGSATKPPMFPTESEKNSPILGMVQPGIAVSPIKPQLRKTGTDGLPANFLRRKDNSVNETTPAFVKEFAGVLKRRSSTGVISHFNPNEHAPPRLDRSEGIPETASRRPHSAHLSSSSSSSSSSSNSSSSLSSSSLSVRKLSLVQDGNGTPKRTADNEFMSKFEALSSRAEAALRVVDGLDVENDPSGDEVTFDEEEVLKTCQDFINDYNHKSQHRGHSEAASNPVAHPRESLQWKSVGIVSSNHPDCDDGTNPNSEMSPNGPSLKTRHRSSSLTLFDHRSPSAEAFPTTITSSGESGSPIKPILKKSTEDLLESAVKPILKMTEFTGNGILKKRSSHADELSGSNPSKGEHVRIQAPSPVSSSEVPSSILRSRNNSICESSRASSPDNLPPSILKKRSSLEDLDDLSNPWMSPEPAQPPQGILKRKFSSAATSRSHSPEFSEYRSTLSSRSSPEPQPQGILKRKYSSAGSRSHSPDAFLSDHRAHSSRSSPEPPPQGILKRKYSSAHASRSHSPEIASDGTRLPISSILKKQTGSLECLEVSLETDSKIKSILKKRSNPNGASTDDDLDVDEGSGGSRPPRSILKSRKSEESLSPLSDCAPLRSETETENNLNPKPILVLRRKKSEENILANLTDPSELTITSVVTRKAPLTSSHEDKGEPLNESGAKPRPILKNKESKEDLTQGGVVRRGTEKVILSPTTPETRPSILKGTSSSSSSLDTSSTMTCSLPFGEVHKPSFDVDLRGESDLELPTPNGPFSRSSMDGTSVKAMRSLFSQSSTESGTSVSRGHASSGLRRTESAKSSSSSQRIMKKERTNQTIEDLCLSPGRKSQDPSSPLEPSEALPFAPNRNRRKSLVKYESLDAFEGKSSPGSGANRSNLRGVLKKDSSYDETLRPILKNADEPGPDPPTHHHHSVKPPLKMCGSSSNNSSSDDLPKSNQFSDVIIDPVKPLTPPAIVSEPTTSSSSSSTSFSRKSSLKELHARQPVIPLSNIKISSDDPNLASKLEVLSSQAQNIRRLQETQGSSAPSGEEFTFDLTVDKSIIHEQTNNRSLQSRRVLRNSSLRLNSNAEDVLPPQSSTSSSTTGTVTSDLNPEAYYQLSKAQDPALVFPPHPISQFCDNHQSLTRELKESWDLTERELIMERDRKIPVGGTGITERLAALKKSGEENWKKKVPGKINGEKANPALDILNSNLTEQSCDKENNGQWRTSSMTTNNNLNNRTWTTNSLLDDRVRQLQKAADYNSPSKSISITEENDTTVQEVTLRNKSSSENKRPISIYDRLNKLEKSAQTWQTRIGEKDVGKYTVAGKMQSDQRSKSTVESPNLLHVSPDARAASVSPRTPRRAPNEDLDRVHSDRVKKTPKLRSYTGNKIDLSQIKANSKSLNKPDLTLVTHEELKSDQGLDSFFSSMRLPSISMVENQTPSPLNEPAEEFDFDSIMTFESSRLSMPKRISRAHPNRRTARNPVKSLAERTDVKVLTFTHIDEPEPVVASQSSPEVTLRRDHKRASTNSKHAHLAEEAIAGLAATEDFSNIQLRKSSNVGEIQSEFIPYKSPMLLQVKGRRCCQTRLVKPVAESINSGDAFILVTNKQIFNWQGRYANVIEKSRSAEIAATILKKKDLGCKRSERIHTLEEEKLFGSSKAEREFWSILGVPEDRLEDKESLSKPAGPASEDEEFELTINDLNLVWEVAIHNGVEELIPCEKAWGCMPKHELLDPAKVLVIDFGTETYSWNGSNAEPELRKAGLNLLKKVWDSGFDFSGADCPHPLLDHQSQGTRPSWGIMGKINQNMETILFKEKFLDWPDQAKISRVKQSEIKLARAIDNHQIGEIDVQPYDAETMIKWVVEDPNLELENSYLGRGRGYYDESERRQYELETLSVQVHHVNEYNIAELPKDWSGQFHSEDTYVVRWMYKVSLTGRDLKGRPSKHAAVGRERCAYFFWQGADSKTTEKGASALMTVEMDREEGPQLRVDHGKEHAAFLNMWNGSMVIYRGKRTSRASRQPQKSPWRMFMLRGECSEESCLEEVTVSCTNLRSIGSFVLVNVEQSKIFVWQGVSSPGHKQTMAIEAAKKLEATLPEEMGFQSKNVTLHIETEGQESSVVKSALGLPSNTYLRKFPGPSRSPRLFHMSSVATGQFNVTEIICPFLNVEVLNTMPFSQSDLYSSDQPALFLFDVGNKLWLWQGYWPEVPTDPNYDANEDNPNNQNNNITGSGMIRWHAERRAAMQTAVDYRRLRYGLGSRAPKAELVWAGWEPLEFTNLFPIWVDQPDARRLNEEHVKHTDLEMTLEALSKTEYSWEELQQRPLPDGVDPAKLERYLSEDEFQSHFGFTKKDYVTFPRWKQIAIRKEKGLF